MTSHTAKSDCRPSALSRSRDLILLYTTTDGSRNARTRASWHSIQLAVTSHLISADHVLMSTHNGQQAGTSSQEHHGTTSHGASRMHNGNGEFLYCQFASVPCLTAPRSLLLLCKRYAHRKPCAGIYPDQGAAHRDSNRERCEALASSSLWATA